MLINRYIENKGILNNYHSFNYSIIDGELMLNKNIISPYFSMSLSEYKNLLSIAI
jgi:hypothetical protein